jgi:release factor glutamine methyltransferase
MTNFGKLSKLKEDPTIAEDTPSPTIKLRSHIREDIPDAYIRGWIEFYKLKFKVTPDVLIPRPETELLVDEAVNWLKGAESKVKVDKKKLYKYTFKHFNVLEIGTGSGAIAISIAKNFKYVRIMATDISQEALKVARENANQYKDALEHIFFLKSDLLELFSPLTKSKANQPDIIITNLPYIPTARIPYLDPSVKDFEPFTALDGGWDGFEIYRRLFIQMLEKNLIPKLFIGEIDDSQGKIALEETKKYFPKAKAEVKKDLAKKSRILIIKFN